MRYDEERQIYRNCKFCKGTGCLACKAEADKAFSKVSKKPIATFKDNKEGQKQAGLFLKNFLDKHKLKIKEGV